MDNGLIFPYRQHGAPDEPGDANHPKPHRPDPSGRGGGAERGIRTGSSQAMGRRRKVAQPCRWWTTGKDVARVVGKSAALTSMWSVRSDAEPVGAKWVILCCQEKPLASHAPPVPQTDSGDQVENTKAIETTMVKERGKMPPSLREKG